MFRLAFLLVVFLLGFLLLLLLFFIFMFSYRALASMFSENIVVLSVE